MIGKGKPLLVHDDCIVSRVAYRLEELCGEIELCQSILQNAPDLPTEYRRVNKEQARQRLELARWNLDDLLEDIEDGIVVRELKRIYNNLLSIKSPYNTYKNPGLPPGPIRIPSVAGIDAVLNHVKHEYIYMCAKEDFSGTHNFARTY